MIPKEQFSLTESEQKRKQVALKVMGMVSLNKQAIEKRKQINS